MEITDGTRIKIRFLVQKIAHNYFKVYNKTALGRMRGNGFKRHTLERWKMKKRRLKSLTDIRRFLASMVNLYECELIDEARLKTYCYACNILAGIIKSSDLEERLETLEKAVQGQEVQSWPPR